MLLEHVARTVTPLSPTKRKAVGKRRYQRIAVRCGCWLEHEQATVFGTTIDLARGGLFLRTALPMDPGSVVDVMLQLPGSLERVEGRATITRRVSAQEDGRPGLGMEFIELSQGAGVLERFLGI